MERLFSIHLPYKPHSAPATEAVKIYQSVLFGNGSRFLDHLTILVNDFAKVGNNCQIIPDD